MSYLAEENAEWRKKKISVFGAVKSFIGQLSLGQDLTKVSLPSEFLHPFSGLELIADRWLRTIDQLKNLSEVNEEERIEIIGRWFLAAVGSPVMEKKPYNSILAENHLCSVTHETLGKVSFFSEQVSHHPPIAAFRAECDNFIIQGSMQFGVSFNGNWVQVKTTGNFEVQLLNLNETYLISKFLPDCIINNVILPFARKTYWEDKIQINCKNTGLTMDLSFSDPKSLIQGTTRKQDNNEDVILSFKGIMGKKIDRTDKKQVFLDSDSLQKLQIDYPEEKDPLDSLVIWEGVSKAIVAHDMELADKLKVDVENAQRQRRANDSNFVPKFFKQDNETQQWVFIPEDERKKEQEKKEEQEDEIVKEENKETVTEQIVDDTQDTTEPIDDIPPIQTENSLDIETISLEED